MATTTAPAAAAAALPVTRRGHTSARNAAPAAASRPHARGSPSAPPTSAPSSVAAFHSTNTLAPVAQNPSRPSAGSRCAVATAVDSSMVSCAASTRRSPRTPSRGATCTAYRPLRAPSSTAEAAPASPEPPAPSTPTSANCEPPVNISTLSAQACAALSPEAVASAPKETPYAPEATPTESAWRHTARRSGPPRPPAGSGRAGGACCSSMVHSDRRKMARTGRSCPSGAQRLTPTRSLVVLFTAATRRGSSATVAEAVRQQVIGFVMSGAGRPGGAGSRPRGSGYGQ